MERDSIPARLSLVQYLYLECVTGVSQALTLARQPPLRADEKEAVFGAVERAAWSFPDSFFMDAPPAPEGWADRAAGEPRLTAALEDGVSSILMARTRGKLGT